jgi:GT2 family glycosyltransferase
MQAPNVKLIVPNWNRLKDTIECLESLKKVDYPNYSVILVDNGSSEDISPLREKYSEYLTLIRNPENLGSSGAFNVGMKAALADSHTDYVVLLNNDITVAPDFIWPLVELAEKNKDVGAVGGKIYLFSQPDVIWFAGGKIDMSNGRHTHIGSGEKDNPLNDSIVDVDYANGCCMLIKREVREKVGFIDEGYFGYFEESDWCVSIRTAGYRILIQPRSKIWHKVSLAYGGANSPFTIYLLSRNLIIFTRKHLTPVKFCRFLALHLLITEPIALLSHLKHMRFNCIWPEIRGLSYGLLGKKRKSGLERKYL